MKTFFCKLVPPRPTFLQDMSEAERAMMQDHARYWRGKMDQGKVVAFGLVADPAGPYGMGIIEVADDREARMVTDNDPVVRSGQGARFEIFPMPQGAVHPTATVRA
jgi:hypothetical protein